MRRQDILGLRMLVGRAMSEVVVVEDPHIVQVVA